MFKAVQSNLRKNLRAVSILGHKNAARWLTNLQLAHFVIYFGDKVCYFQTLRLGAKGDKSSREAKSF